MNSTTGWVINFSGVFKTVSSYLNWQKATITGGSSTHFTGIYATSPTNIYVVNRSGEVIQICQWRK
ncbi:MAG: hypothetical protein WKF35_04785 [Ferruginibacter sp.]